MHCIENFYPWNEQKRFHTPNCVCQISLFELWPFSTHATAPLYTHKLFKGAATRLISEWYFRVNLSRKVKLPMTIGLKMQRLSPQPMSLTLILNEKVFSLVSYTVLNFFVSQTSTFCQRFIHCNPTKIGACLHWNSSVFAKNPTFKLKMLAYGGQQVFVLFLGLLKRG